MQRIGNIGRQKIILQRPFISFIFAVSKI